MNDPLETVALSLIFLLVILGVVVYRSPQWPAISALFRAGG